MKRCSFFSSRFCKKATLTPLAISLAMNCTLSDGHDVCLQYMLTYTMPSMLQLSVGAMVRCFLRVSSMLSEGNVWVNTMYFAWQLRMYGAH